MEDSLSAMEPGRRRQVAAQGVWNLCVGALVDSFHSVLIRFCTHAQTSLDPAFDAGRTHVIALATA